MNLQTFQMPQDVALDGKHKRRQYVDALRDWVNNGDASPYALSPEDARDRVQGPSEEHAIAAAHFRLGQYLFDQGHIEAAQKEWGKAKELRPESWNYIRQSLEIEEVGKASGPEYFAQVQALGDKPYYPPVQL